MNYKTALEVLEIDMSDKKYNYLKQNIILEF